METGAWFENRARETHRDHEDRGADDRSAPVPIELALVLEGIELEGVHPVANRRRLLERRRGMVRLAAEGGRTWELQGFGRLLHRCQLLRNQIGSIR